MFAQEVHVYRVAYHVAIVVGDKQELIVPFQVMFPLQACVSVSCTNSENPYHACAQQSLFENQAHEVSSIGFTVLRVGL